MFLPPEVSHRTRIVFTYSTIHLNMHPSPCLSLLPYVQLRTDAEKRSLVESGLSWYSEEAKAGRKQDGSSYDTGSLNTELPSRWRKVRPQEGAAEEVGGRGELKKPQSLGQQGHYKKTRNPPVGVTSPITHTSQSVLKVAGEMLYICVLSSLSLIVCLYLSLCISL